MTEHTSVHLRCQLAGVLEKRSFPSLPPLPPTRPIPEGDGGSATGPTAELQGRLVSRGPRPSSIWAKDPLGWPAFTYPSAVVQPRGSAGRN